MYKRQILGALLPIPLATLLEVDATDLNAGLMGYNGVLCAIALGGTEMCIRDRLNKKSGVLGISGVSSDMPELLAACAAGNEKAILAE